LPAVAKPALQLLILLRIHNFNRFVSKHSNHKPIGIEILYICFRCLQRKQLRIEPFCSVSLISSACLLFAQPLAQPMLLPLQTISFMLHYPENLVICCFLPLRVYECEPPVSCSLAIFSVIL